jgi:glutamine synthetase
LVDAIDALEEDPVVCSVLDAAMSTDRDPDERCVSQYFAQLKRDEFYACHAEISAWEIEHYLTAF